MNIIQSFKNLDYFPFQPEFETLTEYYIEYKQRNSIHSTTLFYQFKINRDLNHPMSVVPDGCIDILFCCNPINPCAHVCGTVLKYKTINFQANCDYFGVRFLPKQETRQFRYSMKEMIDRQIPLADMIKIDPSIMERIINERDFRGRIKLFTEEMGKEIFSSNELPAMIDYSLNKIYLSKGNISMNQLAVETGYSSRYLRKQFDVHVGMPPKLFSQIVRFQNSLHLFLNKPNHSVWDVINESGYYDQSHLINEFKRFGYRTPNKFRFKEGISPS
ncbi:helix-turn-helix domain-containing protein [Bacillus sp. mrc49]|uniref:helix-turn-helix domain-containing protein n=1 Tax=Bacillus sp. mrc49 TaxID=2054913 RepID=UPI000C276280|nr:helix-turn-helix domain-containing protein [Bacillus sp. mrc49]PJN90298.1 AraC family transcriptional regulator [Bacillus sp. mrc49]